jgi:hypothetical protein
MINDFIVFFMAYWAVLVLIRTLGMFFKDIISDYMKIRYRNKYVK